MIGLSLDHYTGMQFLWGAYFIRLLKEHSNINMRNSNMRRLFLHLSSFAIKALSEPSGIWMKYLNGQHASVKILKANFSRHDYLGKLSQWFSDTLSEGIAISHHTFEVKSYKKWCLNRWSDEFNRPTVLPDRKAHWPLKLRIHGIKFADLWNR